MYSPLCFYYMLPHALSIIYFHYLQQAEGVDGDIRQAFQWLRKRGIAKATSMADRSANEGKTLQTGRLILRGPEQNNNNKPPPPSLTPPSPSPENVVISGRPAVLAAPSYREAPTAIIL